MRSWTTKQEKRSSNFSHSRGTTKNDIGLCDIFASERRLRRNQTCHNAGYRRCETEIYLNVFWKESVVSHRENVKRERTAQADVDWVLDQPHKSRWQILNHKRFCCFFACVNKNVCKTKDQEAEKCKSTGWYSCICIFCVANWRRQVHLCCGCRDFCAHSQLHN